MSSVAKLQRILFFPVVLILSVSVFLLSWHDEISQNDYAALLQWVVVLPPLGVGFVSPFLFKEALFVAPVISFVTIMLSNFFIWLHVFLDGIAMDAASRMGSGGEGFADDGEYFIFTLIVAIFLSLILAIMYAGLSFAGALAGKIARISVVQIVKRARRTHPVQARPPGHPPAPREPSRLPTE